MINAPHSLLPLEAQTALQRAAQVQPTRSDPLARRKAIEAATQRIKYQFPHLFIKEQEHDCEIS